MTDASILNIFKGITECKTASDVPIKKRIFQKLLESKFKTHIQRSF